MRKLYMWKYKTPGDFSDLLMSGDGEYLTGVWFEGSRDFVKHGATYGEKDENPFHETIRWLDMYFSGTVPCFTPKYKIENATPFRTEVIDILNSVTFGKIVTYGEIARTIAAARGIRRMSAQAVGGAVGWNPICIIIPCHRVIGADGSLTGYGGGIQNKAALLAHEGNDMRAFSVPICGRTAQSTHLNAGDGVLFSPAGMKRSAQIKQS